MMLTEVKKDEIRKDIENLLQFVPEGQRMDFDSELLEELLFRKVIVDEKKGLFFKVPVWSGAFLRKLNLSHVSFEDVSFGNDSHIYDYIKDINKMREIESIMDDFYSSEVDYSGTNVNIDLTKLFCSKHGFLALSCCNLSNLDLSSYDLSEMEYLFLSSCNVSNTGLNIPKDIKLSAHDSNLSFLDLSGRTINGIEYLEDANYKHLTNSILCNTCIDIEFDFSDFVKLCMRKEEINQKLKEFGCDDSSDDKLSLTEVLKRNWRGCFINGQFTLPVEYPEKRIGISK